MSDPTDNALLRSLDPSCRAGLHLALRPVPLKLGVVLYEPGQEVTDVYFIGEGLIATLTPLAGGAVQSGITGREGGVGLVEASGAGAMEARVAVQVEGWAWLAPAEAFRALLQSSKSFRRTVDRYFEALLVESRQEIACSVRHTARQRLARWLLLSDDRVGHSRLSLSQATLAGIIGTQRSTLSGTAASLKSAELITYTRNNVVVVDRLGLEAVACECYAAIKEARARMCQPLPLA